jgi:hypothetical protein
VSGSTEGFAQIYMNILQNEARNASQDIEIVKRALDLLKELEDRSISRHIGLCRQLVEPASRSRRMFLTRAGFIGMGPASLAPGDKYGSYAIYERQQFYDLWTTAGTGGVEKHTCTALCMARRLQTQTSYSTTSSSNSVEHLQWRCALEITSHVRQNIAPTFMLL